MILTTYELGWSSNLLVSWVWIFFLCSFLFGALWLSFFLLFFEDGWLESQKRLLKLYIYRHHKIWNYQPQILLICEKGHFKDICCISKNSVASSIWAFRTAPLLLVLSWEVKNLLTSNHGLGICGCSPTPWWQRQSKKRGGRFPWKFGA